jgi:hypothetical protein
MNAHIVTRENINDEGDEAVQGRTNLVWGVEGIIGV